MIKDSLDNIEESGDLSRGGVPSSYKGLSVTIKNTGREFELMKAQGIFLTGKRAEVVRFIGTEADPYSIEKTIVFSGICEDPVWTETELENTNKE